MNGNRLCIQNGEIRKTVDINFYCWNAMRLAGKTTVFLAYNYAKCPANAKYPYDLLQMRFAPQAHRTQWFLLFYCIIRSISAAFISSGRICNLCRFSFARLQFANFGGQVASTVWLPIRPHNTSTNTTTTICVFVFGFATFWFECILIAFCSIFYLWWLERFVHNNVHSVVCIVWLRRCVVSIGFFVRYLKK